MKKGIVLGFSAAIVVVVLLVAGSSLGAYVRAQVEEREAGAIACHDSVTCSRSDWVMQVTNTGTGKAISAVAKAGGPKNAAIAGSARGKARGVYGVSKKGEGVYGLHSTSGNYGFLGSSNWGVHGDSISGIGVYGYSTSGWAVAGQSITGTGMYAISTSGNLIEGWDASPHERRFYVSNAGDVYVNEAIHLDQASLPSTPATGCVIWCDGTSLNVKFSNGVAKTIATNTP